MSSVEDLTELVERAVVAERAALASKWQERPQVEALRAKVQRALDEQRDLERHSTTPPGLTAHRAELRDVLLTGGSHPDGHRTAATADEADQLEADAVTAVTVARLALLEAHLAVLDARLGRMAAAEADPGGAAGAGHVGATLNPVSRHGPALANGLQGEISYVLTRKPRTAVRSLAISLAMGLLYLGFLRVFDWDTKQRLLPYLGLWVISVVMGGAVCLNAMSFDAMRVRAALDSGARLWHLLVVKNLALVSLVAPIGFLLSALLAWRAGDLAAFFKACALVVCSILLWLGVGNVLSIVLPIRDEPIRKRRQSGTLKQFLIAFATSYLIGYMVNLMLFWRVLAARELAVRMGGAVIPTILIVLSSVAMWVLLTVFAVAVSQQPKVRRVLMREITDYTSNAEAQALAREAAQEAAREGAATPPAPVGGQARESRR